MENLEKSPANTTLTFIAGYTLCDQHITRYLHITYFHSELCFRYIWDLRSENWFPLFHMDEILTEVPDLGSEYFCKNGRGP